MNDAKYVTDAPTEDLMSVWITVVDGKLEVWRRGRKVKMPYDQRHGGPFWMVRPVGSDQ